MESKHDRVGNAHGKLPIINSIYDFSADALGQMRLWLEQNPPAVSISSIIGFSQFAAKLSPIVTGSSTTTSSTFGNLPDGLGPSVTALSDGQYVFLWGCSAAGNPGVSQAQMKLIVNGTVLTNNVCGTSVGSLTSVMTADILTLSGGNNSVVTQYASSDNVSTCTFSNRWALALRFTNK